MGMKRELACGIRYYAPEYREPRAGPPGGKTSASGIWLHRQNVSSPLSLGLRICVIFRHACRFCVMIRPFVSIEPSRDRPGKTKLNQSYGSDTLPIVKPPETSITKSKALGSIFKGCHWAEYWWHCSNCPDCKGRATSMKFC